MVRTLLNELYYLSTSISRGYILFNNENIIDHGREAKPEYELSELVINYDYRAIALHGFSLAVNPTHYLFRGLADTGFDHTVLSGREKKLLIQAVLYELYQNGVTLPILYGEYVDVANKFVKENKLSAVLIVEKDTIPRYKGVYYVDAENNKLYYNDELLGEHDRIVCRLTNINNDCFIIDVTTLPTYNVSVIALKIYEHVKEIGDVLRLLTKPYRLLGLDDGVIGLNAKPDLIVYDLRDSRKAIIPTRLNYVILRGYPPDQVFVSGDSFFDHGEPLVIQPVRVDDIIMRETLV